VEAREGTGLDLAGLNRLIEANFETPPLVHNQMVLAANVQRDGLSPMRVHTEVVDWSTGPMAASQYVHSLFWRPDKRTAVRVMRVQAYTMNTAVPDPNFPSIRTASASELRLAIGGPSNCSQAAELVRAGPGIGVAAIVGSDSHRHDMLASSTTRPTYTGPPFYMGAVGGNAATIAAPAVEYLIRRTPALNDEDTHVLVVQFCCAPAGVYPPN
jgi:hypothetical protein